MDRKIAILLAVVLLIGGAALSVQAQSGGPPPRASVHIVQRGETIFSIARQYGLTVDAVTHANGLPDPRQIYLGQRLVIPGEEREIATAEEMVPYVVRAGDTLSSIARRYHTTWQTLVRVNGLLSPDVAHVGQVIQVPGLDRAADGEGAARLSPGGEMVHVVRSDDTLLSVALRYDSSPWMLAALSHVANPALVYPGQELVVPGEGSGLLPAPFVSVEIQPLPVTQGKTMVVAVRTTEPVTLKGRLFEQGVRFAEEGGVYYGLVGVHVFTEPGLYELELNAVDGQGQSSATTACRELACGELVEPVESTGCRLSADVVVEAGRFGYERIDVSSRLLDPTIVAAERERLNELRYTFTQKRHWSGPFQKPCVGTISSYFGAHRAYSGGPYTSYHSGVDFRVPGGTPVYAPAGGTVVMAEPLRVRGNAVVLDHGWGVLTGYWHLSSIEVQVGQRVAQGDLIGKVGSTGLSTGAHLHWEVWAGGTSVNGLQWLEEFYPFPIKRGSEAAPFPIKRESEGQPAT